jgi:hypothetical protein
VTCNYKKKKKKKFNFWFKHFFFFYLNTVFLIWNECWRERRVRFTYLRISTLCSVVWGIGLHTLVCWDHGFVYHRGHGCSSLVFVACCVGSDLAARSPTGCVEVWDRDFKTKQLRPDLGCWVTGNSKCCAMSCNGSVERVTWLRTRGRRNTLVKAQTGYRTHPSSCLIGGDPSLELKILNNIRRTI